MKWMKSREARSGCLLWWHFGCSGFTSLLMRNESKILVVSLSALPALVLMAWTMMEQLISLSWCSEIVQETLKDRGEEWRGDLDHHAVYTSLCFECWGFYFSVLPLEFLSAHLFFISNRLETCCIVLKCVILVKISFFIYFFIQVFIPVSRFCRLSFPLLIWPQKTRGAFSQHILQGTVGKNKNKEVWAGTVEGMDRNAGETRDGGTLRKHSFAVFPEPTTFPRGWENRRGSWVIVDRGREQCNILVHKAVETIRFQLYSRNKLSWWKWGRSVTTHKHMCHIKAPFNAARHYKRSD